MSRCRMILVILLVGGTAGCRAAEIRAVSAHSITSVMPVNVRVSSDPDRVNRVRPIDGASVEDGCTDDRPPAVDQRFSLREDLRNFGPTLWEDTRGVANTENALILGLSAAAAIGIRQDLDDRVREAIDDNPNRWGDATRVLGYLGEAQYQVPVLMAMWGYSVHTDNTELHDLSRSLISAYTINGLATLAVKGTTDTDRPDADWNGGRWGFPSFHASSAFTIGAVLEEYYGWRAGLPAYALAGLISWSRLDEQDHDLSDVVFGGAMGWVIGKSVAAQHLRGDGRVLIFPWTHPAEPAVGLAAEARF